MDKTLKLKKRPRLISVMCFTGYLWTLKSLPFVFSPPIKHMGDWFPAIFGLFLSLKFISYVGTWHLKKWGLELMILAFFLETSLAYAVDKISIADCIVGAISIFIFSFYYKRMDENL